MITTGTAAAAALLGSGRRLILDLPGWEDYSVWGYDETEGSLFAQLWPNLPDDASEDEQDQMAEKPPLIWITPAHGYPQITNPADLAAHIAARTRMPLSTAMQSLASSAPPPLKAILLGLAATRTDSRGASPAAIQ